MIIMSKMFTEAAETYDQSHLEMAEGHLEQRLEIKIRHNEIVISAGINHMADQLKK